MNVRKVLRDARNDLKLNGWCQNAICKGKARCASFAIECATPGVPSSDPDALMKAQEPWARLARVIGGGVVHWNDTPGRTFDEVIRAFNKAIR